MLMKNNFFSHKIYSNLNSNNTFDLSVLLFVTMMQTLALKLQCFFLSKSLFQFLCYPFSGKRSSSFRESRRSLEPNLRLWHRQQKDPPLQRLPVQRNLVSSSFCWKETFSELKIEWKRLLRSYLFCRFLFEC